jgi:RecB family exonuclease/nucleotide-binding universal stress UspA family protein
MTRAVRIIDWRADFIAGLGRFSLGLDPERTLILFPHNRPARHLKAWYKTSPEVARPRLLPRMAAFDAFVQGLRRRLSDNAPVQAGRLDQAGLLLDVVRAVALEDGPLSRLPLTPDDFLPWGVRLAALMEDLLRQGVTPRNLAHLGGEVTPWAAALLARLGDIASAYVRGLEDRGWTTPGLDHRFLAGHLDRVAGALAGTTVAAAGFYALSGTERLLFKRLWDEGGLEILWHTDPDLALGRPGHRDATLHRAWLAGFGGKAELIGPEPEREGGPEVEFVEGFDLHSQLHALRRRLDTDLGGPESGTESNIERDDAGENGNDAAIVLPETGALLPVLHHLPEREVNISMGYPLERTGLYQLVDGLLRLQERRDGAGRYFWRDLLALLRQPYLKMLSPAGENGPDDAPLRRVFRLHEGAVRQGGKYQDPLAWLPPYGETLLEGVDEAAAEPLRREVFAVCLEGFARAGTLAQLADALSALARLLRVRGAGLWKRFVIDAEYLARLTDSIIPELKGAALGGQELDRATLFAVLRQLCRGERVSFEPEPLTGLQVMGVLETRLLRFRRLYVLDAVEDRLPSGAAHDPLLPDPLRALASLPDSRERDAVSAYNFKRLLLGAERAVLFYQSGVQPGLFDSRSVRSRYVEELIWEREKRERRGKSLLKPGEEPIETVHFPAVPAPAGTGDVPMSETLAEALRGHLRKRGLSPTRLDLWLTCPRLYLFRHLLRLEPPAEVDESGDRAAFGEVMHRALQEFFSPFIGSDVQPAALDAAGLGRVFSETMAGDERLAQASWDVRRALEMAGRERLARLLRAGTPARILALERKLSAPLEAGGEAVSLRGTLDRVDLRAEGVMVLDYKTGSERRAAKSFWEDGALWERIAVRAQGLDPAAADEDPGFLPDLKKALVSVQLPVYLHLAGRDLGRTPHDAALVSLAKDGREFPLLGNKLDEDARTEIIEQRIPLLLSALLADMQGADRFRALAGKHCEWCDHRGSCGR